MRFKKEERNMNKKIVFGAAGVLALAGLVGAFATNSGLASAFALSRTYEKTKTTVDVTELSSFEAWEGWEGYYQFTGSGKSTKGATVRIFDATMDELYGSSLYINGDDIDDYVTTSNDYLMKLYCPADNDAAYVSLKIMIHEKAELNDENTYLSYTNNYGQSTPACLPLDYESGENPSPIFDVYEDPNTSECYVIYQWSFSITNLKKGNTLTIHSIHIEYNC